jgi:hypothetical protein
MTRGEPHFVVDTAADRHAGVKRQTLARIELTFLGPGAIRKHDGSKHETCNNRDDRSIHCETPSRRHPRKDTPMIELLLDFRNYALIQGRIRAGSYSRCNKRSDDRPANRLKHPNPFRCSSPLRNSLQFLQRVCYRANDTTLANSIKWTHALRRGCIDMICYC